MKKPHSQAVFSCIWTYAERFVNRLSFFLQVNCNTIAIFNVADRAKNASVHIGSALFGKSQTIL